VGRVRALGGPPRAATRPAHTDTRAEALLRLRSLVAALDSSAPFETTLATFYGRSAEWIAAERSPTPPACRCGTRPRVHLRPTNRRVRRRRLRRRQRRRHRPRNGIPLRLDCSAAATGRRPLRGAGDRLLSPAAARSASLRPAEPSTLRADDRRRYAIARPTQPPSRTFAACDILPSGVVNDARPNER